jgi:hypothetical protein
MVVDILTKVLPREKHEHCMKLMGIIDLEFEMEDNDTQLLVPPISSITTNKEDFTGIHGNVVRKKT